MSKDYDKAVDTLMKDVKDLRADMKGIISALQRKTEDYVDSAKESLHESAAHRLEQVREAADAVGRRYRDGFKSCAAKIEERPFTSLLAALGVGVVLVGDEVAPAMRIIDDIILLLAAAARAGSAGVASAVVEAAGRSCVRTGLLAIAFVLLLGAMGLMIAALFIGLTPYLGAHRAAMIAAGASLAGSGLFMAIAFNGAKGR